MDYTLDYSLRANITPLNRNHKSPKTNQVQYEKFRIEIGQRQGLGTWIGGLERKHVVIG